MKFLLVARVVQGILGLRVRDGRRPGPFFPTPMSNDQDERRAYWSTELEKAHGFMQQALAYPVAEGGEKMISLIEAATAAGIRIDFSTRKHALGLDRLFYLREGQIKGFLGAGAEMNRRGWVMKVEDGFRSRQMQKYVGRQPAVFDAILRSVVWELNGKKPTPEFFRRRSLTLVALMPKIGTHMSGSAIDISVFRLDNGQEIDRGGPYLEMSERTPMLSPFVSPQALENRKEITAIMRRGGFVEYPWEFWHYNGGDAYEALLLGQTQPARYGAIDWSEKDGTIRPIPNPEQPLNSTEEFEQEIAQALRRLRK